MAKKKKRGGGAFYFLDTLEELSHKCNNMAPNPVT